MVHEAWNFTKENKVVLIIDFLKPQYMGDIMFTDANFNKAASRYFK